MEVLYLSSVLYKFDQGGYLPLAFAGLLMTVMFIWNDVYRRKYYYELEHKVSSKEVEKITSDSANLFRIPGLAMFYSELVHGIPPIFRHYVSNVPALHNVLVFVSIKCLPISKVPLEERFLFRRVEPRELNVFRCVARYGYTDVRHEHDSFEKSLVDKLKEFMKDDFWIFHADDKDQTGVNKLDPVLEKYGESKGDQFKAYRDDETNYEDEMRVEEEDDHHGKKLEDMLEREIEALDQAGRAGVVHLIGENEVVACKEAGIGKRILIDYAYNFLKNNLRQTDNVFDIPHKRMLKVGMTYEL
ncbi:hypothetical protein TIFTF001_007320 [Ficus carica]|uniref:Potassium transporter n=1 Tax=Ficus carica TaxID=3494 RepID=A0AA88CZK7_FICCA|nr:hypothetical protein TIFTF001_007320 [Ficus carica]